MNEIKPEVLEELKVVSKNFHDYMEEAAKKANEKYSASQLYCAEYRPDIMNFHYAYFFANESHGVKIVVNTYNGKSGEQDVNYLITPIPRRLIPMNLAPFDRPPGQSNFLNAAINASKVPDNGYGPSFFGAIVFLQAETVAELANQKQNPDYWFLDVEKENPAKYQGWIIAQANPPHEVKRVSGIKPVNP